MPAAEINPDKVFLKIGVAFLNNSGIVFVYLICSFEYYIIHHSIFTHEMKVFYSAIFILAETPSASPISAIKNNTEVPP